MSASVTISSLEAKLVTFDTPLHYTEVVKRLEGVVNKQGSGDILSQLKRAGSREKIEQVINNITGANDFLYFMELNHHNWLNVYHGVSDTPVTIVYTIGNPLIAQTILRYDLRASLHIPPRLLILEKADRIGTSIIYQLPSSVMALPDNTDPELRIAVEGLDKRLEGMIRRVVGSDTTE